MAGVPERAAAPAHVLTLHCRLQQNSKSILWMRALKQIRIVCSRVALFLRRWKKTFDCDCHAAHKGQHW